MKLAIISTHPIQYYSPWFRHLAEQGESLSESLSLSKAQPSNFSFEVFYAHKQTAKGQAEAGFGVEFEWDVPVLEGYPYRFLKNVSQRPGLDWFGGCDCPEIGEILVREGFTHVLLIGWHKKVFWQAFWAAKKAGIKVLSRGDSQLGMQRSLVKRWIKEFVYRPMLRAFDAHLYVGQRNFAYLRHYGVPKDRLFFSPHFVDNEWWAANAERSRKMEDGRSPQPQHAGGWATATPSKIGGLQPSNSHLPTTISEKRGAVFLFAGKFIPKKRVSDLLEAAAGVPEARVVLVGDGPLRPQLEERAKQNDLMEEVGHSPFAERVLPLRPAPAHSGHPVPGEGDSLREGIGLSHSGEYCYREDNKISRVLFAGFRNQGQLPAYLAGADCLVLPSDGTETWGLIVNEAMACGTPAIVSKACGCEPDLIVHDQTGYSFRLGDVQGLAECLRRFVARKNEGWSERVHAKISQYTIEKATEGLARAMAAQS